MIHHRIGDTFHEFECGIYHFIDLHIIINDKFSAYDHNALKVSGLGYSLQLSNFEWSVHGWETNFNVTFYFSEQKYHFFIKKTVLSI